MIKWYQAEYKKTQEGKPSVITTKQVQILMELNKCVKAKQVSAEAKTP